MGANRPDQELIAVRRSLRDAVGAGDSAAARDIVDDDRPAERLAQRARENASDHVAGGAGGKRDNHGDGPGRPVLGSRRRDCGRDCDNDDAQHELESPSSGPMLPWITVVMEAQSSPIGSCPAMFATPAPARRVWLTTEMEGIAWGTRQLSIHESGAGRMARR